MAKAFRAAFHLVAHSSTVFLTVPVELVLPGLGDAMPICALHDGSRYGTRWARKDCPRGRFTKMKESGYG
jgi:hypothetical protein